MSKRLIIIMSSFIFIAMLSYEYTFAAPTDQSVQEQTQISALNHTLNFQVFNTIPSLSNTLFPSAGGSSGCPHIVNDRARQGFHLPVTAQLISDMGAALASGGIVEIGFRTRGSVIFVGSGVAYYRAKLFVVLRQVGSGRVILMSANEIESAPPTNLKDWINVMQPGDILVVGGSARGSVDAGGCSDNNEAAVFLKIEGSINGDPDRPVIVGG